MITEIVHGEHSLPNRPLKKTVGHLGEYENPRHPGLKPGELVSTPGWDGKDPGSPKGGDADSGLGAPLPKL